MEHVQCAVSYIGMWKCPKNVKHTELVQYNTINFKKFPEFAGVIYRNCCMREKNV